MVHRTDIAGGSLGQASPDRMCRRALKWAPPRKQTFAKISARFTSARFSVRRHDVLLSPHDGSAGDPCHPFRTTDPMRL